MPDNSSEAILESGVRIWNLKVEGLQDSWTRCISGNRLLRYFCSKRLALTIGEQFSLLSFNLMLCKTRTDLSAVNFMKIFQEQFAQHHQVSARIELKEGSRRRKFSSPSYHLLASTYEQINWVIYLVGSSMAM